MWLFQRKLNLNEYIGAATGGTSALCVFFMLTPSISIFFITIYTVVIYVCAGMVNECT